MAGQDHGCDESVIGMTADYRPQVLHHLGVRAVRLVVPVNHRWKGACRTVRPCEHPLDQVSKGCNDDSEAKDLERANPLRRMYIEGSKRACNPRL